MFFRNPILVFFLLALFSLPVLAQQIPDYKSIEAALKTPEGQAKHRELLSRFIDGDTSMNLSDSQFMVYGQLYDSTYNAYAETPYEDSLQKEMQGGQSLSRVKQHLDQILAVRPFSLRYLEFQQIVLDRMGRIGESERVRKRFLKVANTMFSTGDGFDKPIHVLCIPDEYKLLNLSGFEAAGEQSLQGQTDRLTLKKNSLRKKAMYFYVGEFMRMAMRQMGK
jgi:hypothetical protein